MVAGKTCTTNRLPSVLENIELSLCLRMVREKVFEISEEQNQTGCDLTGLALLVILIQQLNMSSLFKLSTGISNTKLSYRNNE